MTITRPTRMARFEESFALFADVLLLGVMTSIASLGVVTAYPAFVAACQVLSARTHEDRNVGPRGYLAVLGTVLKSGPLPWLFVPALAAWAVFALLAVQSEVPGATVLTPVMWGIGVVLLVVAARAATTWSPGETWTDAARRSAALAIADPIGSLMVAGALAVAVGIGISVIVLLPLLPGALALAAVAAEHRREDRAAR